ncbi:MAG: hypothetical protein EOO77_18525 [Oxalobacteraceae bacterium]|nr:MAG: hypothetical protein EOO77_18525 [Oxalobacteraceae bacterium]
MSDSDGETELYFVDVPTEFYSYYCVDIPEFTVVSANEDFVTMLFRQKWQVGQFETAYKRFGYYAVSVSIRQADKRTPPTWTPVYIRNRYGLDLLESR